MSIAAASSLGLGASTHTAAGGEAVGESESCSRGTAPKEQHAILVLSNSTFHYHFKKNYPGIINKTEISNLSQLRLENKMHWGFYLRSQLQWIFFSTESSSENLSPCTDNQLLPCIFPKINTQHQQTIRFHGSSWWGELIDDTKLRSIKLSSRVSSGTCLCVSINKNTVL